MPSARAHAEQCSAGRTHGRVPMGCMDVVCRMCLSLWCKLQTTKRQAASNWSGGWKEPCGLGPLARSPSLHALCLVVYRGQWMRIKELCMVACRCCCAWGGGGKREHKGRRVEHGGDIRKFSRIGDASESRADNSIGQGGGLGPLFKVPRGRSPGGVGASVRWRHQTAA
jgi:hypothetical protein